MASQNKKQSPHQPRVFIIVLNWNGADDTIACLHSLQKLRYTNYSLLVVDNASKDHSVTKIQHKFPEITILTLKENKGYAGGNNEGIRYALENAADYIWLLNNDTIVDENALQPLVDKMEARPAIGICGSKLIFYHQPETIQALGGGRFYKMLGVSRTIGKYKSIRYSFDEAEVEQELDFISGASVMVSRKFVEVTGLMNEEYFLFYEEMDWALRGRENFRLGFAPESVVYHKHGISVNKGMKSGDKRSKLADYYQIKNRLKFSRAFYPQYLPTVYLTVLYALLKRLGKRKWKRAAAILKLMFTFNN